jgi:deoxyhypusine synthase
LLAIALLPSILSACRLPARLSARLQMIARLGQEINHPDSIYYWAWKNDIPVFCPALTGGLAGGWVGGVDGV